MHQEIVSKFPTSYRNEKLVTVFTRVFSRAYQDIETKFTQLKILSHPTT